MEGNKTTKTQADSVCERICVIGKISRSERIKKRKNSEDR